MGSSASKAVRYPEAIGKAVGNGMKKPSVPTVATSDRRAHLAETHKIEAIDRDSADPHFLANLNRLGPVRVDRHMQSSIHPDATSPEQLFESRQEESEKQLSRNRLYGFSMSELLDRQKDMKTHEELVKLAEEFKIDVDKLKGLVKFVNSPSVDKASIRPAPGTKKGEDLWVADAVWVEGSIRS